MKNLKYIIMSVAMMLCLSSCSDWLEIYPENSQPTDTYWKTKEEVESTLFSGYYYLRSSVVDYLIPWGELRAGCIFNSKGSNLQSFQVKPTNTALCTWAPMYKIVNIANLVLTRAAQAQAQDDTYEESELKSHYSEAYFLRALAYFYIVRNWRNAPLLTQPFETDEVSYNVPQSSDTLIIAQIKQDLKDALATGAAKDNFTTTWETKGRATKWAIYALMTDVCLWNSDFDEAIKYADFLLQSTSSQAPRFMKTATHASWFSMFNPGNSNESIFEIQWSHEKKDGTGLQTNNLPVLFDDVNTNKIYQISYTLLQDFNTEYSSILENYGEENPELAVRSMYGGYFVSGGASAYQGASTGYIWKYCGGTTLSDKRTTTYYDPNFIIYRVADVMLMKAEALIMRHMGQNFEDNQAAMAIINQVRTRTNLEEKECDESTDFVTLMDNLLYERIMEFAGEGKAWYDFLRVGHYKDPNGVIDFKKDFLIPYVVKYNKQASETWINSVLSNENAWYLPVSSDEMETNPLLVQNPYYL
jgi:hypothetical protein